MRSRRTEFLLSGRVGRAVRWLLPAVLFALAPKCLVCVLGYAGLATALGLGGRELCGPPTHPSPTVALALGALVVAIAGFIWLTGRGERHRLLNQRAAPPAEITSPGRPSVR
jgi:hypothetical protein